MALFRGWRSGACVVVVGCLVGLACPQPPDDPGPDEQPCSDYTPRDYREPEDQTPSDGIGTERHFEERYGDPPHPRCVPPDDRPESEGPVEVLWDRSYTPGYRAHSSGVSIGRGLFLHFYAGLTRKLDMDTGKALFSTPTWAKGDYMIAAGADGLLYIFCPNLRAVDPETFWMERYIFARGMEAFCLPPVVLEDGRVLVYSQLGYLTLLAPPEGGVGHFEIVWEKKISGQPGFMRTFYSAEHDLAVIPAPRVLYGVRVADGEIVWELEGVNATTDLLPLDGGLFAGMFTGRTQENQRERHVQVREIASGALVASSEDLPQPRSGGIYSAATPSGDRIYLVQNDYDPETTSNFGLLNAYDRNLNLLWTWRAPPPYHADEGSPGRWRAEIRAPPVVTADGSVVVSSENCHVYRIDRHGEVVWSDRHPYPAGHTGIAVDEHDVVYALSHKPTGYSGWFHHSEISRYRAYRTLRRLADPVAPDSRQE